MSGLVILSGKEKGFIVGADVNEFDGFKTEAEVIDRLRHVLALFDRIERLSIPVVAGIHGVCVGGGLELVLALPLPHRHARRGHPCRLPRGQARHLPGLARHSAIHPSGRTHSRHAGDADRQHDLGIARPRHGPHRRARREPRRARWAARRAVLKKRKAKPAGLTQDRC